jgi:aminoglycoside phosphotransferase (APT) family kinase protein
MKAEGELVSVRSSHRFNVDRLTHYLRKELGGFQGKLKVRQFGYGKSNPTFLLSDGRREYVLRKKPRGKLLPSAHAVEREYRILKTLKHTNVPVPGTYLFCTDESVIGTPFYIMERVKGRIFRNITIGEISGKEERAAVFSSMVDTLARIHQVDWKALGLADYGTPGNYVARQISRWIRQYKASCTQDIQSMNDLMRWLNENSPEDETSTIAHGDFRLENLVFHPVEPHVTAVLDWELSTLGHPLADFAYNCMVYYFPAHRKLRPGFKGLNLEDLGVPAEREYVEWYCRLTGRSGIPDWKFFIAFSIFRLAAIIQGVYKRGLDGNASFDSASLYGSQVRMLADIGWHVVSSKDEPSHYFFSG